jgi:iron complex transport system ATP-binding protein
LSFAIELRKVSAHYPRPGHGVDLAREAPLTEVSLAVEPGELLVVLGPNGAGKSTLLRVLAGTLATTSGDAFLFGAPLEGMDREEIARKVSVVSQSEDVVFEFTVREVVAMGRAPHQGLWKRETPQDRTVIERELARLDLEGFSKRAVCELSGGERKRVAIARALAQEPRVLLLDEPGAFLDVKHEIALFETLAGEVRDAKLACVVVMHDLNVAALYATRVALLKGGRLVAVGQVDEVMTETGLRETFDADLYCGGDEATGSRFFLPKRGVRSRP